MIKAIFKALLKPLMNEGGWIGGSSSPGIPEKTADEKRLDRYAADEMQARFVVNQGVREGLSGQFGLKRRLNPRYKEMQDRIAELKNSGGDSNSPPAV